MSKLYCVKNMTYGNFSETRFSVFSTESKATDYFIKSMHEWHFFNNDETNMYLDVNGNFVEKYKNIKSLNKIVKKHGLNFFMMGFDLILDKEYFSKHDEK